MNNTNINAKLTVPVFPQVETQLLQQVFPPIFVMAFPPFTNIVCNQKHFDITFKFYLYSHILVLGVIHERFL